MKIFLRPLLGRDKNQQYRDRFTTFWVRNSRKLGQIHSEELFLKNATLRFPQTKSTSQIDLELNRLPTIELDS